MNLHESIDEFKNLIELTSQELEIRTVFVEKDYWVTYVLYNLSKSEFKDLVVFKGGTSLSKAFRIVERFSEDVDLVLLEKSGMSANQIRNLLSKIEKTIISSPMQLDENFKSSKGSKIRKTGYKYPKTLNAYDFGHAIETLVLELNAFANPHPVLKVPVQSYIADFLLKKDDQEAIKNFGLESFDVTVLDLSRTFIEKLLSLVRISIHDNESYSRLREKVRHFYDIHQLLKSGRLDSFINSSDFEKTIRLVLNDDLNNPEFKEDWTINNINDSRLFTDSENVFSFVKLTFDGEFKSLLYQPENSSFEDIKKTFHSLFRNIPLVTIHA